MLDVCDISSEFVRCLLEIDSPQNTARPQPSFWATQGRGHCQHCHHVVSIRPSVLCFDHSCDSLDCKYLCLGGPWAGLGRPQTGGRKCISTNVTIAAEELHDSVQPGMTRAATNKSNRCSFCNRLTTGKLC